MTEAEFHEITILIPGYSVEDLPSDLNEQSAASLLNAFSVSWHPHLLLRTRGIPQFRQADSTELPTAKQIIFVPECAEDWLGHDWQEQLQNTESITFNGLSSREEYATAITEHFGEVDDTAELLNHFYSLGTCYLQVMVLSRRMHFFVDPDQYVLEAESVAAAEAFTAGDAEKTREHLTKCFECLLECREQFHPVECFLLDVCLPSDQSTPDEIQQLITESDALSLLLSSSELDRFCGQLEGLEGQIKAAVSEKRLSLLTGHQHELRLSLGSLAALVSDLEEGTADLRSDGADLHWARRRFGMSSQIPAVLKVMGFRSALHVALDDGLYPDREQGQMKWQAADGTAIPATSRIPVAIDGAAAFLRFADRYTESMQEDSVGVMLLARLPVVQSPWLSDLKTAASYCPVLGKMVTFSEYMDLTDSQSSAQPHDEGEYLSPYLIQSSVLKTDAPISSPAGLYHQRARLESIAALSAISRSLKASAESQPAVRKLSETLNAEEGARLSLEQSVPIATQAGRLQDIANQITAAQDAVTARLLDLIPSQESKQRGVCLLNPLPFRRAHRFVWPAEYQNPAPNSAVQEARKQGNDLHLWVEVPAGGFVWLRETSDNSLRTAPPKGKPLAEGMTLRNMHYEVEISEATGGITSVTFHQQRTNRVSQHLAFRYENSQTMHVDDQEVVTSYAAARMESSKIIDAGPATGCIETVNVIQNVTTDEILARFRQRMTVDRHSSQLQIQIVFDELRNPTGNPWMTYFASRFAWINESASIVRGILGQARGFRMERFESPDFVEVADHDTRLLIQPHGRPYHRRSGTRMLDSLLVVEGEPERSFQFTLDFQQSCPSRAAAETATPIVEVQTSQRIPKSAESGWMLGITAKNVQLARARSVDSAESGLKIQLLLAESEGRRAACRIHTARPITSARVVDASGEILENLNVKDGVASLQFGRYQIKLVELTIG